MIRDVRNLSQTQKTLELDCSTGILMPLFDPDTNMLFLAGKGDTTILYMELTDREPYLIEGLRHSGKLKCSKALFCKDLRKNILFSQPATTCQPTNIPSEARKSSR
jgi:hypothetical protein